ncbi:MAG: alpha/beta hydrolase [Planctomycetota bacterium]
MMHVRFDSLKKIPHYRGPLLQTHGDADTVVPYKLGEKLFAAANAPKRFVPIAGGGHTEWPTREYEKDLDLFLNSLPKTAEIPGS